MPPRRKVAVIKPATCHDNEASGQVNDLSDFGEETDIQKLLVPNGSALLASSSFKAAAAKPGQGGAVPLERTYYLLEISRGDLHGYLAASAKFGQVRFGHESRSILIFLRYARPLLLIKGSHAMRVPGVCYAGRKHWGLGRYSCHAAPGRCTVIQSAWLARRRRRSSRPESGNNRPAAPPPSTTTSGTSQHNTTTARRVRCLCRLRFRYYHHEPRAPRMLS